MLNQLLWSKQKKRQLWFAVLGTIIGFFLLLISIQSYFDLQNLLRGEDSNFVIINKKVSLLNLIGGASLFSEEDLKEFEEQPFIKKAAKFNASQFQAVALVSQIGFRSDFFFESVPDDFLDITTSRFSWKEGERIIPIVLSRDYLSLYNFGFAPTRGLPPFTQSTIKRVEFQIRIIGDNSKMDFYTGKIVGFSDRINSILVPDSFLKWANQNYSTKQTPLSKLILEVENPYSPNFKQFIDDNNLELSSGKLIGDKVGNILKGGISIVAFIGFVVLILALMVLILNFRVMVTSASVDIQRLFDIGYTHQTISRVLVKRLIIILLVAFTIALLVLLITRYFIINWLNQEGFDLSFNLHHIVYLTAISSYLITALINVATVQRFIKNIGRSAKT